MKKKVVLVISVVALLLLATIAVVSANGQSEIALVKSATARFHQTQAAQAEGWDLVPGLDHCFENPAGAMGYHYINTALFDGEVDALEPEALVYAPGPNGQRQLGAVEYIVPAGDYIGQEVLGQPMHLNEALGVYVLHAWIWRNNPSGMFEDWNPEVSCY